MRHLKVLRENFDLHADLLLNLPYQRSFERLFGLDLSSRKFPKPAKVHVVRSSRNQELMIATDDRRHHANDHSPSFRYGLKSNLQSFRRRKSMNRRTFLASAAVASTFANPAQAIDGNRITLGVMGTGGRGTGLATTFARQPNVEVAYVCDVGKKGGR